MTAKPAAPYAKDILLEDLRLDPKNPRLPEELQDGKQGDLMVYIAEGYNAIEVGRSIARHGYFRSEPLIVTRLPSGRYRVIEGNRRLVALEFLNEPDGAEDLDDYEEWVELAKVADLPDKIPAIIASSRKQVAPIIGYRHISGIEPWDPHAKARFITSLVKAGSTFEQVSSLVGETPLNVAAHYRNHQITFQAKQLKVKTGRVIEQFGVFTRAMSSAPLRNHIGAPAPSDVKRGDKPLPTGMKKNVNELFSWLFGDGEQEAVIDESRGITDLGRAIQTEEGLETLRLTHDLDEALFAAGGYRDRLLRRLGMACNYLEKAEEDIEDYREDDEVIQALACCQKGLEELTRT